MKSSRSPTFGMQNDVARGNFSRDLWAAERSLRVFEMWSGQWLPGCFF